MLPIEHLRKSNTIENLWIYILTLLKTKKREIYGWELLVLIKKEFNFKPGKITPYRVLYRLEKDGFVKSGMKGRRRIYQITRNGERELELAKEFYKKILNKLQKK